MNQKKSFVILLSIATLLLVLGAFLIGRQSGNATIQNIATNEMVIKQIAELNSLEVQGNASINHSNKSKDPGLLGKMRDAFVEQSLQISVPYVAKYGVDLEKQKIRIDQQQKTVTIHLPEPEMLSFELKLDKITTNSKEGWLQQQNNAFYTSVQKQLYEESRANLAKNEKNKVLAREKIVEALSNYYQPIGYSVQLIFGNSTPLILKLNEKK